MAVNEEMVLQNLDGWTMEPIPSDLSQELDNETVYHINKGKVTTFIGKAKNKAAAYCELQSLGALPDNSIVDEAVATWAAGLLWNMKLDSEAPNYESDQKGQTYGDKLISDAQTTLKPFIGYTADTPDHPIMISTSVSNE